MRKLTALGILGCLELVGLTKASAMRCKGEIIGAGLPQAKLIEACTPDAAHVESVKYTETLYDIDQNDQEVTTYVPREDYLFDFGSSDGLYFVAVRDEKEASVKELDL